MKKFKLLLLVILVATLTSCIDKSKYGKTPENAEISMKTSIALTDTTNVFQIITEKDQDIVIYKGEVRGIYYTDIDEANKFKIGLFLSGVVIGLIISLLVIAIHES